jgi:glycosyltransferase involved in cell wall biosynthesis
MSQPLISLIVPAFNEQEVIPALHQRLQALLSRIDGEAEVIFVDDGSADATHQLLSEICRADPRFKLLRFARNFGHQAAISAGIEHARGDAVVVMDADLQDPPEVVLELIARWREGGQIVNAVRKRRAGEGLFKRLSAALFYRVLETLSDTKLPPDVGDFRLIDREVADVFRSMPERNRYVRGMLAWVGFRQVNVYFTREGRGAGQTHYSLASMVRLAANGIIGFSIAPLRFFLAVGLLTSIAAFVLAILAIAARLFGAYVVPGWASIFVVVLFLGGAQLFVLGVIGEYIGRIYDEVKGRPLYVVESSVGLDRPKQANRVP